VSQKAVRCSNPKRTTAIFSETAYIVAGERRVVLLVEYGELNSVEAGDASFGGYPKISIAGLKDLVNTILRKTVFARPGLMPQRPRNRRLRIFTTLLHMGFGI
jgi:hypothetical protein